MTLDEEIARWELTVPTELTSDVLCRNAAYRLATFASDFIWPDIARLAQDPRTKEVASQLFRATGSIGSNYSEGYSRGTDRDRCRVYEYAIGSAREARDWSYKARHVIGEERAAKFLSLLTRIIQLLTVTVVRERSRNARFGPEEARAAMRDRDDERGVTQADERSTKHADVRSKT
jgi:four helix bundle protein